MRRVPLQEIDAPGAGAVRRASGARASSIVAQTALGRETPSIYRTLQEMAQEADSAGDVDRAAEIRAVMAEIEDMVNGTLAAVAARVDEFSGTPIDSAIDTVKLRSWLQEQAIERPAGDARGADRRGRPARDLGVGLLHHAGPDARRGRESPRRLERADRRPAHQQRRCVLRANSRTTSLPPSWRAIRPRPARAWCGGGRFLRRSPGAPGGDALRSGVFPKRRGAGWRRLRPGGARHASKPGATSSGPARCGRSAEHEAPPSLSAPDLSGGATYIDDVRDASFSRSALAASEETLERQAAGLAGGDGAAGSRAPDLRLGHPRALARPPPHTPRRGAGSSHRPTIGPVGVGAVRRARLRTGTPGAHSTRERERRVRSQASNVSWESGLRVFGDLGARTWPEDAGGSDSPDVFRPAPEPEDVEPMGVDEVAPCHDRERRRSLRYADHRSRRHRTATMRTRPALSPNRARRTGRFHLPGAGDGAGSAFCGHRSYDRPGNPRDRCPSALPATRQARTPRSPAPRRWTPTPAPRALVRTSSASPRPSRDARSRGRRGPTIRRSWPGRSMVRSFRSRISRRSTPTRPSSRGSPVSRTPMAGPFPTGTGTRTTCRLRTLREWAEHDRNRRRNRGGTPRTREWSGDRGRRAAIREANARWSEFAALERTSSTTFGDDSRQLMYHVECDDTVISGRRGTYVDRFRGADPPSTIDRAHTSRYVPGPRAGLATRVAGFGRLSHAWNEFPFSPRERIVNALHRGEALRPDRIISLELGLESYRAAGRRALFVPVPGHGGHDLGIG